MDSYCSQLDEISDALQDKDYKHPWCEPSLAAEISIAAEPIYGLGWKFDPTKHPSEVVRLQIQEFNRPAAKKMREACEKLTGRNQMSWYQIAREVHRVFATTLDYGKGSLDSHLLEQSHDGRISDGFTLRRLMKKSTITHKTKKGISINCDSALAKIKYEFVPEGIKTYFTSYKAQLALFREQKVAYVLPEEYHCDRILSHLRLINKEFMQASNRCLERIEDGKMEKKIDEIYSVFQTAEENHHIGPDYHGSQLARGILGAVNLARIGKRPPPRDRTGPKRNGYGKHPKGSCSIHKFSTNHLESECTVRKARNNFVCPFTGRRGLSDELVCPLCPLGWHPAELHDNPMYNPPRPPPRGKINEAVRKERQQLYEKHLNTAKANLAHVSQWMPVPPAPQRQQAQFHSQPATPSQPPAQTSGSVMMAVDPANTVRQLQAIQQQLMNHAQRQHQRQSQPIRIEPPSRPTAIAASAKQVHPAAPNARTLVQLGQELHHIRTTLNTQRM